MLSNLFIPGINTIYGEPGTGKTTLCLMHALLKKTIFIDTKNSFNLTRAKQINEKGVKNILLFKAKDFDTQHNLIEGLLFVKPPDTIVIDSFTAHYRLDLQSKRNINILLIKQLSTLKEFAQKEAIPIVLTSEVYTSPDGKETLPIAHGILSKWSDVFIKLSKNPSCLSIQKHRHIPQTKIPFKLTNKGLVFS